MEIRKDESSFSTVSKNGKDCQLVGIFSRVIKIKYKFYD